MQKPCLDFPHLWIPSKAKLSSPCLKQFLLFAIPWDCCILYIPTRKIGSLQALEIPSSQRLRNSVTLRHQIMGQLCRPRHETRWRGGRVGGQWGCCARCNFPLSDGLAEGPPHSSCISGQSSCATWWKTTGIYHILPITQNSLQKAPLLMCLAWTQCVDIILIAIALPGSEPG